MKPLLTFSQAQQALGMKGPGGRRLKRMVLARERSSGKRIAIRCGTKKPTYKVTMSALRKHLPHLFERSKVQTLGRDMQEYLDAIDDVIADRVWVHITDQVEPRLEELWERDETIALNVTNLAARVEQLAKANRP